MADDSEPTDAAVEPEIAIALSCGEAESRDSRTARQKLLDAFEDGKQPLTVQQLMNATALPRLLIDPLLSRLTAKGVLMRVAPATYQIVPAPPVVEPPPAPAEVARDNGLSDEAWVAILWEWERSGGRKWSGPGAAPHTELGYAIDGCRVPWQCWSRFQGELTAVLQQRAEDQALRDRLVVHAAGNVRPGPKLDDLRPVRVMLAAGIPLEEIETVVKQQHDRRLKPSNLPLSSWADLLEPVAVHHHRAGQADGSEMAGTPGRPRRHDGSISGIAESHVRNRAAEGRWCV